MASTDKPASKNFDVDEFLADIAHLPTDRQNALKMKFFHKYIASSPDFATAPQANRENVANLFGIPPRLAMAPEQAYQRDVKARGGDPTKKEQAGGGAREIGGEGTTWTESFADPTNYMGGFAQPFAMAALARNPVTRQLFLNALKSSAEWGAWPLTTLGRLGVGGATAGARRLFQNPIGSAGDPSSVRPWTVAPGQKMLPPAGGTTPRWEMPPSSVPPKVDFGPTYR